MKPEIKTMLPELPEPYQVSGDYYSYTADSIKAWLDKLTEGAQVVYLNKDSIWCDSNCSDHDTHTALLICPREIKKQTALEIAVSALHHYAADTIQYGNIAREALAQIEAAK